MTKRVIMRAVVEWDGRAWVAIVEGQHNVFTQAARLEQLPGRLSEVTHLMLGRRVKPDEWDLDIRYKRLGKQAAEIRRLRSEVDDAERRLSERTARIARALRAEGMSLRDIGTLTGMSYQRVHQLVS